MRVSNKEYYEKRQKKDVTLHSMWFIPNGEEFTEEEFYSIITTSKKCLPKDGFNMKLVVNAKPFGNENKIYTYIDIKYTKYETKEQYIERKESNTKKHKKMYYLKKK